MGTTEAATHGIPLAACHAANYDILLRGKHLCDAWHNAKNAMRE